MQPKGGASMEARTAKIVLLSLAVTLLVGIRIEPAPGFSPGAAT